MLLCKTITKTTTKHKRSACLMRTQISLATAFLSCRRAVNISTQRAENYAGFVSPNYYFQLCKNFPSCTSWRNKQIYTNVHKACLKQSVSLSHNATSRHEANNFQKLFSSEFNLILTLVFLSYLSAIFSVLVQPCLEL